MRCLRLLLDTETDQAHPEFVSHNKPEPSITLMGCHQSEICRLPAKGYGTTEFDINDARKQALIDAGK